MAFEEIFRTVSGSVYSFDEDNGEWKNSSKPEFVFSYFGSIDPFESRKELRRQVKEGVVRGFYYSFVRGWHPLGIGMENIGEIAEHFRDGGNGPCVGLGDFRYAVHKGSKIEEIYREISPLTPNKLNQKIFGRD